MTSEISNIFSAPNLLGADGCEILTLIFTFLNVFEQTRVIIYEWMRISEKSEVSAFANSILQEDVVLDEKLLFFSYSVTKETIKVEISKVDVQVNRVTCYGGKKKWQDCWVPKKCFPRFVISLILFLGLLGQWRVCDNINIFLFLSIIFHNITADLR